jgi:hypothetical protein
MGPSSRDVQLEVGDEALGGGFDVEGRDHFGYETVSRDGRRKVELVSGNQHGRHKPCAQTFTNRVVKAVSVQDLCKAQTRIFCQPGEFVGIVRIDAESAPDESRSAPNPTKYKEDKGGGCSP